MWNSLMGRELWDIGHAHVVEKTMGEKDSPVVGNTMG